MSLLFLFQLPSLFCHSLSFLFLLFLFESFFLCLADLNLFLSLLLILDQLRHEMLLVLLDLLLLLLQFFFELLRPLLQLLLLLSLLLLNHLRPFSLSLLLSFFLFLVSLFPDIHIRLVLFCFLLDHRVQFLQLLFRECILDRLECYSSKTLIRSSNFIQEIVDSCNLRLCCSFSSDQHLCSEVNHLLHFAFEALHYLHVLVLDLLSSLCTSFRSWFYYFGVYQVFLFEWVELTPWISSFCKPSTAQKCVSLLQGFQTFPLSSKPARSYQLLINFYLHVSQWDP